MRSTDRKLFINNSKRQVLRWGVFLVALFYAGLAQSQTLVRVQPVSELQIQIHRSVPAQAESVRKSTLSSQLSASVLSLPVREGDMVSAGQMLAQLDCEDSELAHSQARAELDALSANRVLASQQLGRLNKLRLSNNASDEVINQKQAELDVVNARIQSQKIAIRIAFRQVGKCVVRAPYTGIVTLKHAEQGDFVSPGSPMLEIIDNINVELTADVTESELAGTVDAHELLFVQQKVTYPVKIRRAEEVVNSTAQTRKLHLEFLKDYPLPGSVGRLQWKLQGTFLPASLAVARQGKTGIFIIGPGSEAAQSANFHEVADAQPGRPFAVDLDPNTRLVTDGRYGLQDGDDIVVE